MAKGFFQTLSEQIQQQGKLLAISRKDPVIGPSPAGGPKMQETAHAGLAIFGAFLALYLTYPLAPFIASWIEDGGPSVGLRAGVERVGFTALIGLLIAITNAVTFVKKRRRRLLIERLKTSSIPIDGEIVGIRKGGRTKHAVAVRYDVRWFEPHSGQTVTKPSDDVWYAPSLAPIGRKVRVLTDLDDPKAYYVELEPLFEALKREAAQTAA